MEPGKVSEGVEPRVCGGQGFTGRFLRKRDAQTERERTLRKFAEGPFSVFT